MKQIDFSFRTKLVVLLLFICIHIVNAGTGDFNAWNLLTGHNGAACGKITFATEPAHDVTVEFWLNMDASSLVENTLIATTMGDGNTGFSFTIRKNSARANALELRLFAKTPTNGLVYFYIPSENYVGKWAHIAFVISSTDAKGYAYLNGQPYGEIAATGGWWANNASTILAIGNMSGWSTPKLFGKVADFRIWQVARTAAQIIDNYNKNLEGDKTGLVVNYDFATFERGMVNVANPTVSTNTMWLNPGTNYQNYHTRSVLAYKPTTPSYANNTLSWTTLGSLTGNSWVVEITDRSTGSIVSTTSVIVNSLSLTGFVNGDYSARVRTKNTNFYSGWSGALDFTISSKSINLLAGTGGTINSGAGTYYTGTSAIVIANADPGYHFVNWTLATSDGAKQSQSATYTFTVTDNQTLVANFASNAVSLSNGNTNVSDLPNCSDCDVTISGSGTELTIDQNMILNSLVVSPGNKLTLNNGKTLAAGTLTLQSTSSGNATFVDKNTAENPPTILSTVQQYLPETNRNWYISSPIISATNGNLSTGSGVVEYNEEYGTWPNVSGSLNVMKGYISTTGSAGTGTISFSGDLNNGTKSITLSRKGTAKTGFNLVGNPYPSYLMWTEALATSANCLSTIWYRTKSEELYSFQTYNAPSGVGVPSSTTGYIPPMQAFWVRTTVDGSVLTVNNSMRSHGNGAPNVLKAPALNKDLQQLVRLQVSDASSSDETVIYFNPNAENTYDTYDSPKMSNNSSSIPEIYTTAGTEQLVINGMNSIPENTEIPIGFKSGNSTSYHIKTTEVTNFHSGIQILLKDNATGYIQNLSNESTYDFDNSVSSNERFSLIFKTTSVTTENNLINNENSNVMIFRSTGNQIIVNCKEISNDTKVLVYNMVGQKLLEKQIYKNITVIENRINSGIYLVTVENEGSIKTKKVILN